MNDLQRTAAVFAALLTLSTAAAAADSLSLEEAVALAKQHDPWMLGSELREEAVRERGRAAGTLPDPKLSIGVANLPVDSFDFNQEAMTQLRIGVSQTFLRGNTRALQSRQLHEQSQQQPLMRMDRGAKLEVQVASWWLESYRHRQTVRLIEKDRELFEHLVDVAESRYTSAAGKTQQQDLVRAQLELTRLDDRLVMLRQREDESLARLGAWLPEGTLQQSTIGEVLPNLVVEADQISPAKVTEALLEHPLAQSLEQKIVASKTGVELAEQKYKPQWGVNASYGYRDDDPLGRERSDFFSVGVSFDLPLFTSERQDRELQAAKASEAAVRTEKALVLRELRADLLATQSRLHRLDQRYELYNRRLLREIHDQAEASLTAYTNDAGDFSEVVRARIAELNANIDFLNITIDRLKTIAEMNYFLAPSEAARVGG